MYPELKEQLKELRKHLIESTNEMAPLKVWQMQGGSPPSPKHSPLSLGQHFMYFYVYVFYCYMIEYIDSVHIRYKTFCQL